MNMGAMERRIAPRFGMDYVAELASGSALVRVQIRDVSMMGCGVRIIDRQIALPEVVPAKGLLIFNLQGEDISTMLPVELNNKRCEVDRLCYGLSFRDLSSRQKRNLIKLIEENTLQMPWRRAS